MITPLSFPAGSSLPHLTMAQSTGSAATPSRETATSGSFTSVMQEFVSNAAETVRQGETAAIGGIEGTTPVQTVVDRILAAERTLQATIAVRDKLVSSYLEVSRMQI